MLSPFQSRWSLSFKSSATVVFDRRDIKSAATFFGPDMYSILQLYSPKMMAHRCLRGFFISLVNKCLSGVWSVYTVISVSMMMGRNFSKLYMIADASRSIVGHLSLFSENLCEMNWSTRSWPSCSCANTAPKAYWKASVYSLNGFLMSGNARIGAHNSASFSFSKVDCASDDHWNLFWWGGSGVGPFYWIQEHTFYNMTSYRGKF